MKLFKVELPLVKPIIHILTNVLILEDLENIYGQYVKLLNDNKEISDDCIKIIEKSGKIEILFKDFFRSLKSRQATVHCLQAIIQQMLLPSECCCCLHGFAIANDDGDVSIFVGATHSGKSTLGTFLLNYNNLSYVADDIIMIDVRNNSVMPIFRPIHLRDEGLCVLKTQYKIEPIGDIKIVDDEIRYIPKNLSSNNRNLKLKNIFFISRNERDINHEIELTKQEFIIQIIKNSYLPMSLGETIRNGNKLVLSSIVAKELYYSDMKFVAQVINS